MPTTMPDFVTTDHVIAVLGTLIGLWGVLIARRGVNTWREQLHGSYNFELAQKILRAALKVQSVLFRMSHELDPLKKNGGIEYDAFEAAEIELEALVIEADAVLGTDIHATLNTLDIAANTFILHASQLATEAIRPRKEGEPTNRDVGDRFISLRNLEDDERPESVKMTVKKIIAQVSQHLPRRIKSR